MIMNPRAQKGVAVGIAIGSLTCLVATSLMTRQSGISQAASDEGQALMGYASISIHLMAVLFAVSAGVFAAKKWWGITALAWFLVLSCCVLSVTNILEFIAAERLTIAKAREDQATAVAAREKAKLDADAARLKTQLDLAKDNNKWIQGTMKQAEGRRERKDAYEAATKLVETVGKTNPDANKDNAPPPQVIIHRPDGGAELVNSVTGITTATYQLFRSLYFVFVITLVEMCGWQLSAFLWMTAVAVPPMAAAAMTMAVMVPTHSQPPPLPPLEPPKRKLALPPPQGPKEKAITLRTEPTSEWRAILDRIDFPPPGARLSGQKRPKDGDVVAAARFLAWLAAHKESGTFSAEHVDRLYLEFAAADYRDPTGLRVVKPALEAFGKRICYKRAPDRRANESSTMWELSPPAPDKMVAILQKAGALPKAEGTTPAPEAPTEEDTGRTTAGAIVPFEVSAAGLAAGKLQAPANENTRRTQAEIARGLWTKLAGRSTAEWERGQWVMGRIDKAIWQAKVVTPRRKSLNRMSRTRVA